MNLDCKIIQQDVEKALYEDRKDGDKSAVLLSHNKMIFAQLMTRESAILAGIPWFNETFHHIDPSVKLNWQVKDREGIYPNQIICCIIGPAHSILTAERTAINFLQLLSGAATKTHEYVQLIKHTQVKILDTRKTVPGLRYAQKYAVRCGGGENHRFGLYDAIMIKENHIIAYGSIKKAVEQVRLFYPDVLLIVEVENLLELEQALECGVSRILLDNFDLPGIYEAVKLNAKRAQLEVSGGINKENIIKIAQTGVDFISIGNLTKHIKSIDYSLRFQPEFNIRTYG